MPDPNVPDERTRKSPPRAEPLAELAVPARVGQFVVKAALGTGTYGRVLLALDSEMGRQVAIKHPFGEGLKPEYRADLLKEARAAAVIDQHANVCPVYHIDTDGGLPYIVMRFVPGGTLKAIMERRGAFPAREAAAQIARGLAAAHAKGVIHRDLKPANVLFDPGNGTYLLTDFGHARPATDDATVVELFDCPPLRSLLQAGMSTVSITWMTPLLVSMSVFRTFALPTFAPAVVLIASSPPCTVLAFFPFRPITSLANTFPGKTW
jgi:serine/threonine protein kinase